MRFGSILIAGSLLAAGCGKKDEGTPSPTGSAGKPTAGSAAPTPPPAPTPTPPAKAKPDWTPLTAEQCEKAARKKNLECRTEGAPAPSDPEGMIKMAVEACLMGNDTPSVGYVTQAQHACVEETDCKAFKECAQEGSRVQGADLAGIGPDVAGRWPRAHATRPRLSQGAARCDPDPGVHERISVFAAAANQPQARADHPSRRSVPRLGTWFPRGDDRHPGAPERASMTSPWLPRVRARPDRGTPHHPSSSEGACSASIGST
ncbi:MAG: hypothetical protein R2939_10495 [Kofleriaceae bacterium]